MQAVTFLFLKGRPRVVNNDFLHNSINCKIKLLKSRSIIWSLILCPRTGSQRHKFILSATQRFLSLSPRQMHQMHAADMWWLVCLTGAVATNKEDLRLPTGGCSKEAVDIHKHNSCLLTRRDYVVFLNGRELVSLTQQWKKKKRKK